MIAEDQVLLRDGMQRLVADAGHEVVASVGDARSLLQAVNDERPDLVLTDVRMPPSFTNEGARAVIAIRASFPELPVVVLSQIIDPTLVARVVGAHPRAFGYLLKDRVLDTDDFLRAVGAVAAGETVIDPVIVERGLAKEHARLEGLTAREVEILRALASGRSNLGIAADLFISRRTVEAHLRSVFLKLGIQADPAGNQRILAALEWLGLADAAAERS